MNHTQRIAHVAQQKRYLTKALVREAVELYLEALAKEIAESGWVDIKSIGKIQVVQEETNSTLMSFGREGKHVKRHVKQRLRTKIRLYDGFKQCFKVDSFPSDT